MGSRSRAHQWGMTVAVLASAIGAVVTLKQTDLAAEPWWIPKCALHVSTGLHCPGCGNTRATFALLEGDLPGAVRQNLLWVMALPFLGFGAFRVWFRWMYPDRWKPLPIRWRWSDSLILIWIVVLFMILRNLPADPWRWLAPIPLGETNPADP